MVRKVLIGSLSAFVLTVLIAGAVLLGPSSGTAVSFADQAPKTPRLPVMPETAQMPAVPEQARAVDGEVIVKYKGDREPRVLRIAKGASVERTIAMLEKRDDVVYAEPNYLAYALFTPDDPYYRYQWNFYNSVYGGIDMQTAWDVSQGSGVTVAVLDTGIAYENYGTRYKKAPDLANTKFAAGYDFVNRDLHPNDDNGHGTHVAGTIAQSTNNGTGVAGIAYSATLMPVKVLDSKGGGTHLNIAKGIRYAADNGAKVINLSLGGSTGSTTLRDAVSYAYSKGVVVVAAAGNSGTGTVMYPAAYDDYVIAVGATRYDETLAYYSNWGSSIDIVAPGGDTRVDQNGDGYPDGILQQTLSGSTKTFGYLFYQGTSMATPHVSGVAALVASAGVTDPSAIRTIIQTTAEDKGAAGRDDKYGYGLINANAALTAALSQ